MTSNVLLSCIFLVRQFWNTQSKPSMECFQHVRIVVGFHGSSTQQKPQTKQEYVIKNERPINTSDDSMCTS